MLVFTKEKNNHWLTALIIISLLLRILFIGNRDLLAEEAYYWNYAMHLDWGYLDHPPMVAVLIKTSTWLFGINEFGVRSPALLCWIITAYFSYRWSELIRVGTGRYALLLLSILPFFFLYSLIITPDLPLMACWSGGLYYSYQALGCNRSAAWYYAGIAVGLGLLAKYSILLLVLTTGLYMLSTPKTRLWFLRKEPYYAAMIMLILFLPVIYWNQTHDWASFAFQSTRRLQASFHFSLHELLGLFCLFLTPLGVLGFGQLFKKHHTANPDFSPITQHFLQYYTLVPLAVFVLFSITHDIKYNWIGPGILAILPWLAVFMQNNALTLKKWLQTTVFLLLGYTGILYCVTYGTPEAINRSLFNKMISWDNLTQQFYDIATTVEANHKEPPIIVPLDSYSIASELVFYQAKQLQHNKNHPSYLVQGANAFGYNSLMFDYWYQEKNLNNKTLILIGKEPNAFISDFITPLSPVMMIWGKSQGHALNIRPYYYQVAQLK